VYGLVAFAGGAAGGVLLAKLMNIVSQTTRSIFDRARGFRVRWLRVTKGWSTGKPKERPAYHACPNVAGLTYRCRSGHLPDAIWLIDCYLHHKKRLKSQALFKTKHPGNAVLIDSTNFLYVGTL
jgi:hypothetical protein